jgi:hypothetical protein
MENSVLEALAKTGAFTDDDIETLELLERDFGPIVNWSESQYDEAFHGDIAKRIVAKNAVGLAKLVVTESDQRAELPQFPPYLEKGAGGAVLGYDSHDPSQYWTDPVTGKHFRWDGKRDNGPKVNALGQPVPRQPWVFGQPHEVALVTHKIVDGVYIPDAQQAHEANNAERDWFHRGYNVWIGGGGKPYGDVSPEARARFRAAQTRDTQGGGGLFRPRPPRESAA